MNHGAAVPRKWEFHPTTEWARGLQTAVSSQTHGLGITAEKGAGRLPKADGAYSAPGYFVWFWGESPSTWFPLALELYPTYKVSLEALTSGGLKAYQLWLPWRVWCGPAFVRASGVLTSIFEKQLIPRLPQSMRHDQIIQAFLAPGCSHKALGGPEQRILPQACSQPMWFF